MTGELIIGVVNVGDVARTKTVPDPVVAETPARSAGPITSVIHDADSFPVPSALTISFAPGVDVATSSDPPCLCVLACAGNAASGRGPHVASPTSTFDAEAVPVPSRP